MEEKGNQDAYKLNDDIGLQSLYTLRLKVKENCFWWLLLTGMEKKALARSIAAQQVSGCVTLAIKPHLVQQLQLELSS